MKQHKEYRKNDTFNKDAAELEKLYKEFNEKFDTFAEKYPLKEGTWAMTAANTLSWFSRY